MKSAPRVSHAQMAFDGVPHWRACMRIGLLLAPSPTSAAVQLRYRFAVNHSGLHRTKHPDSGAVTVLVYGFLCAATFTFFAYMFYQMVLLDHLWVIEATVQDPGDPDWVRAGDGCQACTHARMHA